MELSEPIVTRPVTVETTPSVAEIREAVTAQVDVKMVGPGSTVKVCLFK